MYDAAGQVTSRTDRNGRTITFGYDHLGRQIQQNWLETGVAVNTITTTYNAAMRVTSIADNDAVNSFTWDVMGRLTSSSNAGTTNATPVVLTNSYDSLGRRSGLAASVNSVADFVNAYSYDTAGRMTQITQTDGNSSAGDAVKDKRVDMSYDSIGRFTSIARYESLNTTNPIVSTAFSYDTAGHLTSLQHTGFNNGAAASSSLAGYSYTWDATDRLTSMNSVRDGLSTYSYDTTDQITAADHTGQSDESFTYDANGNRTSVTLGSANGSSTVTAHNRILNDGKSTYTYDAEGNRTSKTDIATGHKVEYSWNHANQLIAVVYKTYNNTVTKSVAYQYDALGRRIGKSVDDNGDSTMDRREAFVYDGAGLLADAAGSIHIGGPNGALNQAGWTDQLLFQFTDADADWTSSSPVATRFFSGPAVDQIFAVESASGDPLWALTDHQGTPRDWVRQTIVNGNLSTTIAQHIRFTAFGAISSIVDASGNLLDASLVPLSSFTGQLYDADADLMYYRARWYDPVLGKFLNDDPMGFAAGDPNVSRYVGNGAISRQDSTGLFMWNIHINITQLALSGECVPPSVIAQIAMHNIRVDFNGMLPEAGTYADPTLHGTDGKIIETIEHIEELKEACKNTQNIEEFMWKFGMLAHAVQDLYTHTNYVTLTAHTSPPDEVPYWDFRNDDGSINLPTMIHSLNFVDPRHVLTPEPKPSHKDGSTTNEVRGVTCVCV